jgi:ribonuclease P protein subunit RPR2
VKKKNIERIAAERIEILIDNALRAKNDNDTLSQSYAKLASKIAMRVRIRIPYMIRQLICRSCKQFIVPGVDSRVRVGRSKVKCIRITCLKCNHVYRKIIAKDIYEDHFC